MPFRDSSAEAFAAVVAAKASAVFKHQYGRLRPTIYEGWDNKPDFQLHDGPLRYSADLAAPALCTLVDGDLVVDGYLDLSNPHDRGFDEGGLFIVLGSLRCQSLQGEFGKCVLVDGDVAVRDFMLTCQEDSGVWIIGDLAARFLLTSDTWPYVGGSASIEYGDGACLGLAGGRQVGTPLRDRDAAARIIGVDDLDDLDDVDAIKLADDIRAGRVFFEDD